MVSEQPPVSEPSSGGLTPARELSIYLRITAVLSAVAALIAGLIVPGLRGNAPERAVVSIEQLSQAASAVVWVSLLFFVLRGAYDVARLPRVAGWTRGPAVAGAGVVVALMFFAFRMRLASTFSIMMALAALSVAVSGASAALRAPHTRAVGVILCVLALSAVLRIFAWEIATAAGERASSGLYAVSRGFATAGILIEGAGQLIAATWLGTRSRIAGQLLASIAICTAFLLTWGAAAGSHVGATLTQSVLHTALTDAPGLPQPYGVSALATFLTPCAALLGLVAALQPKQIGGVVAALSLSLVARGGYDVPMRALAVTVAGLWLVLATVDERSMWEQLVASRPVPPWPPTRPPSLQKAPAKANGAVASAPGETSRASAPSETSGTTGTSDT